jgi:hypothetical protein
MRHLNSFHSRGALIAIIVLAATASSAAMSAGDPASPGSAPQAPVQDVSPEQAQQFGVLGTAPTKDDALSATAQKLINLGPGPKWGANAGLAHRAMSTANGGVYVVPAKGALCLIVDTGQDTAASTCGEVARASAGLLMLSVFGENGSATVYGVLPDGASPVTLTTKSGRKGTSSLNGGVYSISTDERPQSVAWVDGDGRTHTVAVPAADG